MARPRNLDDLEDCLAMDRDPEVTRYVPGPWSDPAAHRAFVIARMAAEYPDGLGYWAVNSSEKRDEFLGWILLLPYHAAGDEVEIGWRFRRDCWGHGYAAEAASPVLDHAFRTVRLDAVVADIDPRNRASIRVAGKLGMRLFGDRVIDGVIARSYRVTAADRWPVRSFP